jgi:hypothetical protein
MWQVFGKLVCEQSLSFLENEIASISQTGICCEVYHLKQFFSKIFASLFADESNFGTTQKSQLQPN